MGRERKDPEHPRWAAIDDLRAKGLAVPPRLFQCQSPARVKLYHQRALNGDTSSLNRGALPRETTMRRSNKKATAAEIYASRQRAAMKIPMGKPGGLSPAAIWVELKPEGWHLRDWWLLYPGENYRRWGRVVREALDMSLDELQEERGKSIVDLAKGVIGEPA